MCQKRRHIKIALLTTIAFFVTTSAYATTEIVSQHGDWLVFYNQDPIDDSKIYVAGVTKNLSTGNRNSAFGIACERGLTSLTRVVWRISSFEMFNMEPPRPADGDELSVIHRVGEEEPQTTNWLYSDDLGFFSVQSPLIRNLLIEADNYDRIALRSHGITHVYPLEGAEEAFQKLVELCAIDLELIRSYEQPTPTERSSSESLDEYMRAVREQMEAHKSYPRSARIKRQQGTTVVEFIIDRDGRVSEVRIQESAGHEILDDAALQTVRDAEPFSPFPARFERRQIKVVTPISFSLR